MNWSFIDTGFHPGRWNMAVDETLAGRFDPAGDFPILRVYAWTPNAISLGVHQRMDDFDLDRIQRDGIDIVRRPTGGRAIYHAHELTYSVIIGAENRSAREVYQYLSKGILECLHILGIDASVAGSDERLPGMLENPLAIPCFSTSTRSEIQWHGKKIVGSAQRRYGDTILQHGSLLLGPAHRMITHYLSSRNHEVARAIDRHLLERTIEAEMVLGRPLSFDEAREAFRAGFERSYDCTFITADPTEMEELIHSEQSQRVS